ncbi:MAG: hypothetical protein JWN29_2100 [Acidimicrobiales bacterium]|nr:hypothetical protein [Acidimicrobiales bacterium]
MNLFTLRTAVTAAAALAAVWVAAGAPVTLGG